MRAGHAFNISDDQPVNNWTFWRPIVTGLGYRCVCWGFRFLMFDLMHNLQMQLPIDVHSTMGDVCCVVCV
jgi:hypothetical protein